jgi:hypothetical protein
MFNTYHAGNCTQNIKINAVSGAILNNHPKSWFKRFHLKSTYADNLLTEGGHKAPGEHYSREHGWNDPDKDIIVLQMIVCGDMEVIAECVYRKDYDDFCSHGERRVDG